MEIDISIPALIQSWSKQDTAYRGYFATRAWPSGSWSEYSTNPAGPVDAVLGLPAADVYFTPLVFGPAGRHNDAARGFGCLFADLDAVDPSTLEIRPTIAWETSPGSYQAVWRLSDIFRPVTYAAWASLNRRMTQHTGADKGGWMGSKLLRVPGTLNWKRFNEQEGTVPRGRVLWSDGDSYSRGFMDTRLVSEADPGPTTQDLREHPEVMSPQNWRIYVRGFWPNLPWYVQTLLLTSTVSDRSFVIQRALLMMAEADLQPEQAFHIVSGAAWNKFDGRPQVLWNEVLKAYDKVAYRHGG
jgi:hypothetical protein